VFAFGRQRPPPRSGRTLAITSHMNKSEAHSILSECLARYRSRPYAELAALASEGRVDTSDVVAPSGTRYTATSLKLSSSGMASPMPMCEFSPPWMMAKFALCFRSPRVLFSALMGDSSENENDNGQPMGAGDAGLRLSVVPESVVRRA
jgi:hypothetical protein